MPLSNAQLAALVERARQKPPLVASPPPAPATPPQRAVRPAQDASAPPSLARPAPGSSGTLALPLKAAGIAPAASPTPRSSPAQSEHVAEAEDFPIGWELRKESWHFHRRFYAIFKRPMARGEYSHLLWQIRRAKAEHLGEDCWRVTLPGGSRTLQVRGTVWRMITILPKNWQPPAAAAPASSGSAEHAQEPSL
jgi:hypothetical protein